MSDTTESPSVDFTITIHSPWHDPCQFFWTIYWWDKKEGERSIRSDRYYENFVVAKDAAEEKARNVAKAIQNVRVYDYQVTLLNGVTVGVRNYNKDGTDLGPE